MSAAGFSEYLKILFASSIYCFAANSATPMPVCFLNSVESRLLLINKLFAIRSGIG